MRGYMKKVRVGIVGLGRLGMKHAENIALRTAGAGWRPSARWSPTGCSTPRRHGV